MRIKKADRGSRLLAVILWLQKPFRGDREDMERTGRVTLSSWRTVTCAASGRPQGCHLGDLGNGAEGLPRAKS